MLRNAIEIIHIFSVIAWMSGLLYLPRIFAYHSQAKLDKAKDAPSYFETMERKLYHIIMMPAMVGTWVFGWTLMMLGEFYRDGWMHGKLLLVLIMTGLHFYFGHCRAKLLQGNDTKSPKFYKLMNEVPAVILIGILILVVAKPF